MLTMTIITILKSGFKYDSLQSYSMITIARGAEAVLMLDRRKGGPVLIKERVAKGYRVPELDRKIRSQRTKTEERMLSRARRAGVRAPMVLASGDGRIEMEYIEGPTVKETLNGLGKKGMKEVCTEIGKAAAGLHGAGIMHGDLTTSNMILAPSRPDDKGEGRQRLGGGEPGEVFLVDFGLAKASRRVEDFAVDLFLLYEALKAAHYRFLEESWENIIKAYKYNYSIASEVLGRFRKIENRRRYRGG
jgi:Kae1-associated kinase Bud32